jgi:lactoylglutathione lyase
MRAIRFNHVSISAPDLEASLRFYTEVLGLERIPTPDFPGVDVRWVRIGDQQLHLFKRDVEGPVYHHIGIDVDDFEATYLKAKELGVLEPDGTFGVTSIRVLVDGAVQMYLRDPAGNLVEVDHHGVDRLPDDLRAMLKGLWDFNPQDDEQMSGRLFVPE